MENNGKINPQNLGQFRLLSESLTELDELKKIFEELCSKIAKQYSLYYENGKPRKSTLIETIARSPCLTCITKSFSNKTATKNVDSFV